MISWCVGCHSGRAEIRIATPYEIQTLDPHVRFTLSHSAVQFNFYEALVSTDSDMNIHPCLATRWENPDAYTWVFHLNPSVRFHDGKKFSARDVVYTFTRLLGANNLDASSSLVNVIEVKAIDPLTVRVRTGEPLTVFLNKLSLVAIISEGSKGENLARGENGTGPFRLTRWVSRERVEMVRNDDYWGERPFLNRVTLYLGRSPEEAFQLLKSGSCELAQCNSQALQAKIDRARYNVLFHDSFFVKYLAFDCNRDSVPGCGLNANPFKNQLVREAIHQAIDRQDLVNRLPSSASPATQLVPALVFGFNPEIKLQRYNPEAAKGLLVRAGLPNGFEVTLHTRKILESTAYLIKDYLKRIGIVVNLKILPDDQFFNALRMGQACFILSRMGATVGDASDIFESAFHTPDLQQHYGSLNWLRYTNPEVDHLTEQTSGMSENRNATLQKTMAILMKELPWVPLYVDQDVYALDKRYSWKPRLDSHIFAAEIRERR